MHSNAGKSEKESEAIFKLLIEAPKCDDTDIKECIENNIKVDIAKDTSSKDTDSEIVADNKCDAKESCQKYIVKLNRSNSHVIESYKFQHN